MSDPGPVNFLLIGYVRQLMVVFQHDVKFGFPVKARGHEPSTDIEYMETSGWLPLSSGQPIDTVSLANERFTDTSDLQALSNQLRYKL
jgi:hypothetical protein